MCAIRIIDRESGQEVEEEVPYEGVLRFLYGKNPLRILLGFFLCRLPFFSQFFGFWHSRDASRKHIRPFIEKYQIKTEEFAKRPEEFRSFNAFFIRRLNTHARPLCADANRAIIPADGRCMVFPNLSKRPSFLIKGKPFSLQALLQDEKLANQYAQGAMLMVRLAPVDYHRFHFPCNCIPGQPKLINGPLYSVNPIALCKNISILTENKRMLTELKTAQHGVILYMEVGATNVGSIIQTYQSDIPSAKGEEKGYFSFGGSCLLLLFEPNTMEFDQDLVANSSRCMETFCKLGQSLGIFN